MGVTIGNAVLAEIAAAVKECRRANLRGAQLQGADLRDADLRGADFRGAHLRGADLRGADLRGAQGIFEIGGADWSLYLIRWADRPRIKGDFCQWFETRAEAEEHWSAHVEKRHGAVMLAKLEAAWSIARYLGWEGTA